MRKTQLSILFLLLLGVSFLTIECKHEIPIVINSGGNGGTDSTGTGGGGTGGGGTGGGGGNLTGTCSPDTVYFVNTILPMIVSNCATTGCHDATTHREDVTLTNYSQIRAYVSPGSPSRSSLYSIISRGSMPPNRPFTSSQLSDLSKWISQGALNNQCTSACDTAMFTYSGAVAPIMSTYCVGCHNPASLGGGIDLSTYTAVKAAASGRLMGAINQLPGYSAMPKGSNKLSDCQITQIQKWIKAGMLNN